MYCDFFGLRERPFDDRADTRFLYLTPALEEMLAALEYHVRFGHGLSVVLGDAGIGKTTVLRALLARLHATDHMVVVTARAGETKSLIRETAKGFGLTLAASDRGANTLARLERILKRTMEADHRSILIVDQAEHLDESNVDQLGTMLDLESQSTRLLHVVVFAQPRFMQMLDRSECGRIRQQACGAHMLTALEAAQVGPYIQHRLSSGGIADPDVFDPRAYELIHAASGGNQRLVNRICDEALVAAYGSRENPIPLDIVAEIASQHAGTDVLVAGSIVEDRQCCAESIKIDESISHEVDASDRTVQVSPSHGVDSIRPSAPPPATSAPHPIAGIERTGGGVDRAVDDALANVKAQLRRQEIVASSIESLLSDGDTLATRLETAIRQAHRVAATHDTAMGQYTCVEQHLGSLTAVAEQLVASLPGSVDRATQTLSSVERDQARLTDELNERITALEQRSDGVQAVCREIDQRLGSLDRMETASRRAEAIEARLSAYAEQLAEKAEHAQERIALLMTGMDAGENVHVKLETMVRKVSAFVEETDRGIDQRQRSLQETIDQAANLATSGVEDRLTAFRDRLNVEFDNVEHAHRPKIDNALTRVQDQLRALESKANALEERAEESAADARKKFQQTIREFGQAQSHAIDEIIQAKRARLDELTEEFEARTQSFDSAVESRCAELQNGLESLETRHRGFLE
ncbi:MAG: AAA family ATPase, partial [Planctomycetes bacterium]|nr:AAA family ATPase [Planctomycetota bacterium]